MFIIIRVRLDIMTYHVSKFNYVTEDFGSPHDNNDK